MASDCMSKMSPEELQEMFEVASLMNVNGNPFTSTTDDRTQRSFTATADDRTRRSESGSQSTSAAASTSGGLFSNSRNGQASSSFPNSNADLQESLRNSMKELAMREFTSMMKNISPEMMANMSEQYGMKLSKEDASKVQQTMLSLSPEDMDKMMRWAERAQRGIETVKTKNWFLGKPGLILATFILILAFIFHQLGFVGG